MKLFLDRGRFELYQLPIYNDYMIIGNMIDKTPNAQGGIKFDNEKLLFDLLEPEFEEGIAKVLTYGAKKYAPDNWKKIETRRYYHALRRHWNAYRKGERFDEESGESHLYHMACCLMFIDWHDRQKDKKPAVEIIFKPVRPVPNALSGFIFEKKPIQERTKRKFMKKE